jgi:hypothetical protein
LSLNECPDTSDGEQNGPSIGKAICTRCWLLLVNGKHRFSKKKLRAMPLAANFHKNPKRLKFWLT